MRKFAAGDWIVYRQVKYSASPGPRAREISPAPNGELYSYVIEELWIVEEVLAGGRLRARTKRGKVHLLEGSDPNLHRVAWWQRWFYKYRFREELESNASK